VRIAKFGHSCLLVEAASGTRILIDPGSYSSIPDDVITAKIDVVLITHKHEDHLAVDLIRRITAAHPGVPIYGSSDAVEALTAAGITGIDHAHTDFQIGEVTVEVKEAGHEAILGIAPTNTAYRIAGELVVTGDSGSNAMDPWIGSRVLALPIIAPWTTEVTQAALMEHMKPEVAFAVHDGFLIDSYRTRAGGRFEKLAAEHGIAFVALSSELAEI
jgi:L-ascorbate metabolism protein UlaG (beta-lactamase superfamily)